MNRGAWRATVHKGHQELDVTEATYQVHMPRYMLWLIHFAAQ